MIKGFFGKADIMFFDDPFSPLGVSEEPENRNRKYSDQVLRRTFNFDDPNNKIKKIVSEVSYDNNKFYFVYYKRRTISKRGFQKDKKRWLESFPDYDDKGVSSFELQLLSDKVDVEYLDSVLNYYYDNDLLVDSLYNSLRNKMTSLDKESKSTSDIFKKIRMYSKNTNKPELEKRELDVVVGELIRDVKEKVGINHDFNLPSYIPYAFIDYEESEKGGDRIINDIMINKKGVFVNTPEVNPFNFLEWFLEAVISVPYYYALSLDNKSNIEVKPLFAVFNTLGKDYLLEISDEFKYCLVSDMDYHVDINYFNGISGIESFNSATKKLNSLLRENSDDKAKRLYDAFYGGK